MPKLLPRAYPRRPAGRVPGSLTLKIGDRDSLKRAEENAGAVSLLSQLSRSPYVFFVSYPVVRARSCCDGSGCLNLFFHFAVSESRRAVQRHLFRSRWCLPPVYRCLLRRSGDRVSNRRARRVSSERRCCGPQARTSSASGHVVTSLDDALLRVYKLFHRARARRASRGVSAWTRRLCKCCMTTFSDPPLLVIFTIIGFGNQWTATHICDLLHA